VPRWRHRGKGETEEEEEQRDGRCQAGPVWQSHRERGRVRGGEAVLGCLPVRGLCGLAGLVGRAGREVRQAGAIGLERG